MANNIDGCVTEIVNAAHALDLEGVRKGWQALYEGMRDRGWPMDDRQAFRLVEALESAGVFDNFSDQSWQKIKDRVGDIRALTLSQDTSKLADAIRLLRSEIDALARPLRTQVCNDVLKALRDARAHDDTLAVCERLIRLGQDHATLKRFYAQALIEKKQLSAATAILDQLAHGANVPQSERLEAIGLLGRVNKQIYVEAGPDGRKRPAIQEALRTAIRSYAEGVDANDLARSSWHAINLVAMLRRAEADRVETASRVQPGTLAASVIKAMEPSLKTGSSVWDMATAAEAHVALGQWQEAAAWYGRYADHPDITAFHLNSSLRQLQEVWGLEDGKGPGGDLVTLLKARLLGKPQARLEVTAAQAARILDAPPPDRDMYQKMNARQKPARIDWFKTGLIRAQAVARICEGAGLATGTGFLVRPREFSEALAHRFKDEWLLLTNAHVVSRQGYGGALKPDRARIFFDELPGRQKRQPPEGYSCAEIVWESPVEALDAALLRLSPRIGEREVAALQLATEEKCSGFIARSGLQPGATGDISHVFVIGHPYGQDLCFALNGADLLDHGPRGGFNYLHYMTPTEKGNSGSPVLDEIDWHVVALHHAGGPRAMLSRPGETHDANEGIAIGSIVRAVRETFDGPGGGNFLRRARRFARGNTA